MTVTLRSVERKGWVPDQPDHRDFLLHERIPILAPEALPAKLDPSPLIPLRYDQLRLGSCVGNGTARVVEYTLNKQGTPKGTPSRLFIYGGARRIEGTYNSDSGAQIRDGIKAVAEWGAPSETLWPYSDANPGPFNEPIPNNVYAAGAKELAVTYSRVVVGTPGAPMRTALFNGMIIVFGFPVPSYFEDGTWNPATQYLPIPGAQARYIGGHCCVVTGYDWTCTKWPVPVFIIDNSWNMSWGMQGRFAMDSRWFCRPNAPTQLASDLWVIEKMA